MYLERMISSAVLMALWIVLSHVITQAEIGNPEEEPMLTLLISLLLILTLLPLMVK
jgi:hypothetical protein